MKPRIQKQRGLTMVEVLVVVAILTALFFLFMLPRMARAHIHMGPDCPNNIQEIGLSFQIWAGDHDNKFPAEVSVAEGGGMELIQTGNVCGFFQVLSNELNTPKVLVCQEDWGRIAATNFGDDFNGSHISYFIGVDITNKDFGQRILSGDDNFLVNGTPVKSGLAYYPTNISIAWGPGRHGDVPVHHFWTPKPHSFYGWIGMADGSLQVLGTTGLQAAFAQTGLVTNRLAIP
jgi:prepilin-type N-terminal cleavage/methylation domain-containing protein